MDTKEVKPGNEEKSKKSKEFSEIEYLYSIFKTEGISAFYNGLKISLVGALVTFGIYFFWYRVFKNLFLRFVPELGTKEIMLITTLAGSINNLMTTPFWIVQTRMCVDKSK